MPLIFISHASDDKPRLSPYIDRILEELVVHDPRIQLWIDTPEKIAARFGTHPNIKSIQVAEDWQDKISEALDESSCIIAFWSLPCVKKRRSVLIREIDKARLAGKLVQVCLDPLGKTKIPAPFSHDQILDVSALAKGADDGQFSRALSRVHIVLQSTGSVATTESAPANRTVLSRLASWLFGKEKAMPAATLVRSESLNVVQPPTVHRRAINSLPYLVDRKPQVAGLVGTIDVAISERRAHRPIVCTLHGGSRDRLLKLVSRFVDNTLPRQLSGTAGARPIKLGQMQWPDIRRVTDEAALNAQIDCFFSGAILGTLNAELADVAKEIASARRHFAVRCEVDQNTWGREGPAVVGRILKRLSNLPDMPPAMFLIVFLCLEHVDPIVGDGGFHSDVSGNVPGLNRIHAGHALNSLILDFVDQNPNSVVHCALPQLDQVAELDVREWAMRPEVENACDDTDELLEKIKELYRDSEFVNTDTRQSPSIVMADLVGQLKKWLRAA